MIADLVAANTPSAFWRLAIDPPPSAAEWRSAVATAADVLPPAARAAGREIRTLLAQTLGEAQFGGAHWRLSPARRLYYRLKPMLPRPLTRLLRRASQGRAMASLSLDWPAEVRYAEFQRDVIGQLLATRGERSFPFIHFWPYGHRYALTLTHDVETAAGQANVRATAELDASFGFRSSFNFVAEDYEIDATLLRELRANGFEVGLHGVTHDGQLFRSRRQFDRRARQINRYLKDLDAVGFRSPLTLRHPEWMQALEIDYDLSFFDTDPFEPIPGGTMSLWPYLLGRFVELPYTLLQDYTLASVLKETTPRLWLDKIDVIERWAGLALLNTHPDYLKDPATRRIYAAFLETMSRRSGYWKALPREVARWWRARMGATSAASLEGAVIGQVGAGGVQLAARRDLVVVLDALVQ
jgi:peptidoglycan/xylan/chitin deacetylase (PgdA/CDA1 family)